MSSINLIKSIVDLINQTTGTNLNFDETVLAAIAAHVTPPAPQALQPPPVVAKHFETRNSFAPLESCVPLEMEYERSESSASASRKRPATHSGTGSSESYDSDGTGESSFTTVNSKRNGKRAALKRTPPTSAALAAPTTSAAPAAAAVPLMSLDIPTPTKPSSRCAPVLAKKQVPPPVFLRDKAKFTHLSKTCYDAGIKYDHAVNLGEAIKITPSSIEDFRKITRLFTAERISYHTYALPEERKVRAVIRGVPFEFSNEEILEDLKSQGFPVEAVHKMHSRTGKRFNLALVILSNVPEATAIFRQVRTVCGLSRVKVEPPHRRGFPAQCHRCQLYGHAAANCSAPPRCVKCLEPHNTKECPRPKDAESPPSCVLCKQTGHPANYRGCPCAPQPRPSRQAPPPVNDRSFPALHPRPRQGPSQPIQGFSRPSQGPLRPPQGIIRPPPGFSKPMQPPVFPWGPKKADPPRTTSYAHEALPTLDDYNTLYSAIRNIDVREITVVSRKLRAAKSPHERLLVLAEHNNLLLAL